MRKQIACKPPKETQASFLSIQLQQSASTTSEKPLMELIFNNGSRLNFYGSVSAEYLQSLLGYAQHQ